MKVIDFAYHGVNNRHLLVTEESETHSAGFETTNLTLNLQDAFVGLIEKALLTDEPQKEMKKILSIAEFQGVKFKRFLNSKMS